MASSTTNADLQTGELWLYSDSGIASAKVSVLRVGVKKPERVKISFLDDEHEGREEWVPPSRLKAPWGLRETYQPLARQRRDHGSGSVFLNNKGLWTAAVPLPPGPDGKRRRKTVRSKSEAVVRARLVVIQEEAKSQVTAEIRRSVGPTVEEWIDTWFTSIALQKIRPKTAAGYRTVIQRQILPNLGDIPLVHLKPADVRDMHTAILATGLSSTTSNQAYRILSIALKYAVREELIHRNVAEMVDAPRKARPDLPALSRDQVRRVLKAAAGDPLESMWAAVLLTGARQGEILGLEAARVTEVAEISWQLQRLTWQHGCEGTCGRVRGSECEARHVIAPADWERRYLEGGFWLSRPKSRAGSRVIPLVEPLSNLISTHLASDRSPNPHGLVWHQPNGSPIDPKVQSRKWHQLLARAGVPDVRLHDGRHSAVDLMYESGMQEDLIRQVVGHSTREMTRSYKSLQQGSRLTEGLRGVSKMLLS